MLIRTSLAALALIAALTFTACGGTSDDEKVRQHATELQQKAQRTADEVRAGTRDAEDAAKELQQDAAELTDEAIESAKDTSGLPDEAKQQLEQAQAQLDEATGR